MKIVIVFDSYCVAFFSEFYEVSEKLLRLNLYMYSSMGKLKILKIALKIDKFYNLPVRR